MLKKVTSGVGTVTCFAWGKSLSSWVMTSKQEPGLLLEAGTRVPAPIYFERNTRLL